MSTRAETFVKNGGPAPSEINEMSQIAKTFDKHRGEARAFGMTMSLIIKYLQENREFRMQMRMQMRMRMRRRRSMEMEMGIVERPTPAAD